MRLACLFMTLALTSCSHTQVGVNSNISAGTSSSGGSVSLQTNSSVLTAVLIMGLFISAAVDEIRSPQPSIQPMDPQRKVLEQDCTKPVDTTVTLKCR
jgi:hypothetical protein